jgi:hypothetical protein
MTPDVNVLVAASRNDHPHHAQARTWLEEAVIAAGKGASLSLQPMVVARFLRLVTHPKIFVNPTPVSEAVRFVDAMQAAPGVKLAIQGQEWPQFRQLCIEKGLAANDIPDAWLAATVIHQGEHLVSFDGDFRRLLKPSQFARLPA